MLFKPNLCVFAHSSQTVTSHVAGYSLVLNFASSSLFYKFSNGNLQKEATKVKVNSFFVETRWETGSTRQVDNDANHPVVPTILAIIPH